MCLVSTCDASCQLPRHEAKQSRRELSLEHLALAESSAHAPSLPINDGADDDSRANCDGRMEGARCVVENLKAILFEESIRRQNSYAERLASRGRASRLEREVAMNCGRRCVLVVDNTLDLMVALSERPCRSAPTQYATASTSLSRELGYL
jgi:hypothetical protein